MSSEQEKIELDRLIEQFAHCAVANISDNLDRAVGARGIRAFHRSGSMSGRALTVRTAPGDNLFIHKALDMIEPGDVLVVDGGGHEARALIGDIIASIAEKRGAAGIVIDGAIRDVASIGQRDFPVFARTFIHLGPYKNGPGAIGVSVSIGGMPVMPGDVVVGDDDGVVAFSPALANDLLAATRAQAQKEGEILASIEVGTYAGAYVKQ